MAGPLILDFFNQPKYIIPGINVILKLTRAQHGNCLISPGEEPIIKFLEAK
jgi:hypothetical protein